MSKYIDADALIFELSGNDPSTHIPPYMQEYCVLMRKILKEYPAADVAPVVRCSECEYGKRDDGEKYECEHYCRAGCDWHTPANYFCSYGERKDV